MSLVVVGAGDGAPSRPRQCRAPATSICVMASFGTLALLLAFGLLAGPAGGYAFAAIRARQPRRRLAGAGAGAGADRRRLEGRPGAAARLAAARPSGRAQPRLGADERRHDQGRRLRLRAHRVRPARPAGLVVGHGRARARRRHRGARRALRADAATTSSGCSPTARSRTSASSSSASASRSPSRPTRMTGAAALALTAALFHVLNHSLFKSLLFFGAGAVLDRHRRARHGAPRRADPSHAADRVRCSWSAASAISALPPLNGFVSEWLTFQAILLSPDAAAMGAEVPGAGGRRACSRSRPRSPPPASSRPSASRFLGRPRSAAAAERRARPTASRWRRCSCSPRSACWPASCRASSSTRSRRSIQRSIGAQHAGARQRSPG